MKIDLEAMKHKPQPNKALEQGLAIQIGQRGEGKKRTTTIRVPSDASDPEKEIVEEEERLEEETILEPMENPRKRIVIIDKQEPDFNRNIVMEHLQQGNIFSVKTKKLESQMNKEYQEELLKSVEEPTEEVIVVEERDVGHAERLDALEQKLEKEDEGITPKEGEEEEKEEKEEKEGEEENMPKETLKENVEKEKEEKMEKLEKPKKSSTVVIKRKKKEQEKTMGHANLRHEHLKGDKITDLLPEPNLPHRVAVSGYYMANRKKYIQKLVPMFSKYKKIIDDETRVATCEDGDKAGNGKFKLLVHQQVVRDYLNLFTPYRGLLLYHGLGSGKTCSSIAIAEGMKSSKKVYVLTLASLKANFFEQLKVCGDPIYKLNQYWEFVSVEGQPSLVNVLSRALDLPMEHIKKQGGAWMVNVKKDPNFEELEDGDKKAINAQIDVMIRSKYEDINYNGLNKELMKRLTKDFTENPFDNSVVVVDEVHNLVSMIVNKVKEKKTSSLSYRLYEMLLSAENARLVFLSGTPIINYPNEIGVLFNMLRGYIKTWTFPIRLRQGANKPDRDNLLALFENNDMFIYDYVQYSGDEITITRNPMGFVNKLHGNKEKKRERTRKQQAKGNRQTQKEKYEGNVFADYEGVELDETGNMSDDRFKMKVKDILNDNGFEISGKIMTKNHLALPQTSKEFFNLFVGLGENEMKNKKVFQKRILGLSSYFRGADENLYPKFVPSPDGEVIHIENIPMSKYQFQIYEKIRATESVQEKNVKKAQQQQELRNQNAEDLFKVSSTYKIASRNACNFVFPNPPGRPVKPKGAKEEDDEEEENEESMEGIKKKGRKRVKGGEDSPLEELEEGAKMMEKDLFEPNEAMDELEDVGDEIAKEVMKSAEEPKDKDEKHEEKHEEEVDEELVEEYSGNYKKDVQKALSILKLREQEYLSPGGLATYSPKFLRILENIQDPSNKGLHLIYSQFRTMEGIGIIKLVLEANGFAEFKIRKKGQEGDWEMVETEEDKGKPKFALHTGTETDEEKKIILNVYNSKWKEVPNSIMTALQKEEKNSNKMGDIIKVLMITASGAEGINLKNTRFVHLVEPYWHNVRTDQVIGRARRICSHQDLPEELRTVQVFMYIMVLPKPENKEEEQKHIQLRLRDVSKLTNKLANELDESSKLGRYVRNLEISPQVVSTDQMLFESAMIKEQVNNQILHAVKESAMDCQLYNNKNKDENLVCFNYGKVMSNAFGSYPTLEQDIAEKDVKDTRKQILQMGKITAPDPNNPNKKIEYAINNNTKVIYSWAQYLRSKENKETLVPLGKIVKNKKGTEEIHYYK